MFDVGKALNLGSCSFVKAPYLILMQQCIQVAHMPPSVWFRCFWLLVGHLMAACIALLMIAEFCTRYISGPFCCLAKPQYS